MEAVIIRPCRHILAIPTHGHLKLVKDTITLIQVTQVGTQMLMDVDGGDRLGLHMCVPYFQCEVITAADVTAILGEFDITDGTDNLGEEGFVAHVFCLFKYWEGGGREGVFSLSFSFFLMSFPLVGPFLPP